MTTAIHLRTPTSPVGPRDDRVTVVIASRDRRDVLLRNLPRHLALRERPRVVVVDDGSTDGTSEAIAARHPGIAVIRLHPSLGAAARNVGIEAAETPYVALCDDDSWFASGALAHAADLLDRHERLAAVNGHVLIGPSQRDDPLCLEMADSPLPQVDDQPGHPLLSFIACAVVLRRAAVLQAGGFSERLVIGGEEELLGWDMAAAGWTMSYVPEVLAHHHPPPQRGRPRRREGTIRNTLWTTWLRRPARAVAWRTLRDLRRLPRDRHSVRAVARALGGLPWVVRERRVSPPHVERMRRALDEQQLRSESRRHR